MMTKKILLIASVGFLGLSLGYANNASITNMTPWTYSSGIYCNANLDVADQTVTLSGTQWTSSGTMSTTLTPNSTTDPILTIDNSINNSTSFDWTEYVVTVSMNQAFSITSASVTIPGDWSYTITTPTFVSPGDYAGTIDYLGGTPVLNGGTLDFGYVVSFSGSQSYSLTESVQAVPEPGVFSLLMSGGVLLGGWLVAKRRQTRALVRA
jgi:hypothetical protein